ncbi:MAG: sensor histidine kinase [Bacteroidetes bacterium]|nr:sensor histidine kinase [Bacteroidota bacterium]
MNLTTLFNGLNKRILLHLLFWSFYVLFFGSIYGKYGNDFQWYLLESLCMLPFVMLATYTTIYIILPNYLKKRNLVFTFFAVLFVLFLTTLGERIFLRKLNSLDITLNTLFTLSYVYLLLETNFIVATAVAIKIVKKWSVQQQEKHEMEKRNLKTELNLLKAQLHPHFLFNTMNNLYTLSLENSPKTSEGIAKISDLLRSVLYECNDAEITLEKEIKLIENYIDLELLRYGNRLNFNFEITGQITKVKIAPMLLFTFIENCFKHGSSNDPNNPFIKIHLNVTDEEIVFFAENSKPPKNYITTKIGDGGIGLINVKKRLEIIYGENYDLKIQNLEHTFVVCLRISK